VNGEEVTQLTAERQQGNDSFLTVAELQAVSFLRIFWLSFKNPSCS
jgi:hypothetical protein